MSASNKKKLRKQEAQDQLTKRQQAASKEAKKQKTFTLTFWVVIALCVCITLGAVLTNPAKNIIYRNANAVEVGDYTLSAVELNYFYVDAISQFYQNYQSYISYLLNVKAPLNEQVYDTATGQSWADFFVTQAHTNVKSTYAVYDLAMKENFTLPEDYKSDLDSTMMYLSLYASIYGYKSVDAYLIDMYGNGATEESYRAYYEKCLIAEAYYTKYAEDLEYDAEDLTAYQEGKAFEFNSFTFASYYLAANKFYPEGAGGADGKTYTDEEKAAAAAAAKEAADKLAAGEYATLEDFDKAINELGLSLEKKTDDKTESKTTTGDETTGDETTGDETTDDETTDDETTDDETTDDETTDDETTDDKEEDKKEELKYKSTKNEDMLYTSLNNLFRDWLVGKIKGENEDDEPTFVERKEGDLTVIENSSGEGDKKVVNGYYVLRFGSINTNEFAMKNVRHLLVKFQKLKADGTPDTSSTSKEYTEKEKLFAKDEAEKLLKEWLDGEATEETFIELVKKNSDDNAEAGGLYENVYPGQMVAEFEDWCYDEERKVGDYEIIETTYGYHIMYFVGDTEQTYRDYLVTETMRAEDVEEWYTALVEAMPLTAITDKYVDKKITMG